MNWSECAVLVTGSTGSFGKKFTEIVLRDHHPRKLIIFRRDELKQHEMQVAGFDDPRLRYFTGDVRDRLRLRRVFQRVGVVIHAAAFKPVLVRQCGLLETAKATINRAADVSSRGGYFYPGVES